VDLQGPTRGVALSYQSRLAPVILEHFSVRDEGGLDTPSSKTESLGHKTKGKRSASTTPKHRGPAERTVSAETVDSSTGVPRHESEGARRIPGERRARRRTSAAAAAGHRSPRRGACRQKRAPSFLILKVGFKKKRRAFHDPWPGPAASWMSE